MLTQQMPQKPRTGETHHPGRPSFSLPGDMAQPLSHQDKDQEVRFFKRSDRGDWVFDPSSTPSTEVTQAHDTLRVTFERHLFKGEQKTHGDAGDVSSFCIALVSWSPSQRPDLKASFAVRVDSERMYRAQQGQEFEVTGRFDPAPFVSKGRTSYTFQAQAALEVTPHGREDLLRFLSSDRFPGIGAETAAWLLDVWPESGALAAMLTDHPEALLVLARQDSDPWDDPISESYRRNYLQPVKGQSGDIGDIDIHPALAALTSRVNDAMMRREGKAPKFIKRSALLGLARAWQSHLEFHQLCAKLLPFGVTGRLCEKIFEAWGSTALQSVMSNPYKLIELDGIGFKTADEIAMRQGLDPLSEKRMEEGILYVLKETGLEGHTAYPVQGLKDRALKMLALSATSTSPKDHARKLLPSSGVKMSDVEQGFEQLLKDRKIIENTIKNPERDPSGTEEVIVERRVVSDYRALNIEHHLSTQIIRILNDPEAQARCRALVRFATLFLEQDPFSLDPSQRRAVMTLFSSPVSVLTGGPGTGKTHTLKAVTSVEKAFLLHTYMPHQFSDLQTLRRLGADGIRAAFADFEATLVHKMMGSHPADTKNKHRTFTLCAPTGRAAKRMNLSTRMPAATIHRTLEYGPEGFGRDHVNRLNTSSVVVDESSMIDNTVAYAFTRSIPSGARLLFVGDHDQLKSVEAGNVLQSIMSSGVIPVARLEELHRTAACSAINSAAQAIKKSRLPDLGGCTVSLEDFNSTTTPKPAMKSEFLWVETASDEDTALAVADLVHRLTGGPPSTDKARRRGAHKKHVPHADIQVLTPRKETNCGVYAFNESLGPALKHGGIEHAEAMGQPSSNPNGKPKHGDIQPGDRIICNKNDSKLGVFNGDMGTHKGVTPSGGIFFEPEPEDGSPQKLIEIPRKSVSTFMQGYAKTVHKSQGSDYPVVIIPMAKSHTHMWDRSLLYTGVTRGKERVILVGSRKVLESAVSSFKQTPRYSCLLSMLRHKQALVLAKGKDEVAVGDQRGEPTATVAISSTPAPKNSATFTPPPGPTSFVSMLPSTKREAPAKATTQSPKRANCGEQGDLFNDAHEALAGQAARRRQSRGRASA